MGYKSGVHMLLVDFEPNLKCAPVQNCNLEKDFLLCSPEELGYFFSRWM